MGLLRSWADYLQQSLPVPANQLCTDDFTGTLANNTNLAAKGIVALEAFAELCEKVGPAAGDCQGYCSAARGFAATWQSQAWDGDHYAIAFGMKDTYSIKYNLVWQKLLRMNGPFDWQKVGPPEVKYYLSKANAHGTPMDHRHSYVKLDWLSWAAAVADDDASWAAAMADDEADGAPVLMIEAMKRLSNLSAAYCIELGRGDRGVRGRGGGRGRSRHLRREVQRGPHA